MAPGNYMIVIKYCNVAIAGCPFKAVITGFSFIFTVLVWKFLVRCSSRWRLVKNQESMNELGSYIITDCRLLKIDDIVWERNILTQIIISIYVSWRIVVRFDLCLH